MTPMTNITFGLIKSRAVGYSFALNFLKIGIDNGFIVRDLQYRDMTVNEATQLYRDHLDKIYAKNLFDSVLNRPVVFFVLEDSEPHPATPMWKKWRDIMGATRPSAAEPHTLRGCYFKLMNGVLKNDADNAVHGSDSLEAVNRELAIFFPNCNYKATFVPSDPVG